VQMASSDSFRGRACWTWLLTASCAAGLTFDSGGYNLKVNCHIEEMKQVRHPAQAALHVGAPRW